MKPLNIRDFIFIGVLVVICLFWMKSCNKVDEQLNINSAQNDTITRTRNKLGQEVASKELMLTSLESFQNQSLSKDSTIAKLQKIVNKKTISATVVDNKTSDKGSTVTKVTFDHPLDFNRIYGNKNIDTAVVPISDSIDTIYPTYSTKWNERWSSGSIVATNKSISRDIQVFNEFEVEQKFERQKGLIGFFKPNVPKISITNLNPMTTTLDVASFSLAPQKQHGWISFSLGVLSGVVVFKTLQR